VFNKM